MVFGVGGIEPQISYSTIKDFPVELTRSTITKFMHKHPSHIYRVEFIKKIMSVGACLGTNKIGRGWPSRKSNKIN